MSINGRRCVAALVSLSLLICLTQAAPSKTSKLSSAETSKRSLTGEDDTLQGWTFAPDGRGTFDIVWSSFFTTFVCCWSMLCLNVPSPHESSWRNFRRRFYMLSAFIQGPEFLGLSVLGQYVSARNSVRDVTAAGYEGWTLRHAFYADMGGFVLQPSDWVNFPVDAKQLLWLAQHGFVEMPAAETQLRIIKDKNKVDGLMRFIMLFQAVWFMANLIGRVSKGYAVTLLELSTASFIYSSIPILFCWRHKPADVAAAQVLHTKATMAEMLLAGGDAAAEPYHYTPLDFVSRQEWHFSIYLSHYFHGLRAVFRVRQGSRKVPSDRIPNSRTLESPPLPFRLFCVFSLGYGGIYLLAWNFTFPTVAERIVWRVCCVAFVAKLLVGMLITDVFFGPWIHRRHSAFANGQARGSRRQPRNLWEWLRNPTTAQDPRLSMPLWAAIPMATSAVGIMIARAIMLMVTVLQLRSLPSGAFKTFEWSHFLPHFG